MEDREQNLLAMPTQAPHDASADDAVAPSEGASSADALPPHAQETMPPDWHAFTTDAAPLPPHAQATIPPDQETMPPDSQADTAGVPRASAPTAAEPGPTRPPRPTGRDDTHGLAPGVVIDGQYELIRELGRGGMGVVFLARDTRLGRLVAVKFVLLRSRTVKRRFLAEARTTARCNHQNIVVVYEADEFNGLPYMVLEFLEGKTLRQLMNERASADPTGDSTGDSTGGLSVARALELMLPVLRGLERAHGMGIVHRDLKPENVMLTDTGVVKVLDFGIAKSVSAGRSDVERAQAQRPGHGSAHEPSGSIDLKTRAGSLVGTMPYMSPEQFNEGTIDHRVDIWAAGIMLCEMITGKHPMAPLSMATFQRIADMSLPMPRTGQLSDRVGALGPIIDRCLLKDSDDRIGSVTELIAELEPLLPGRRSLSLAEDASPFTGLSAFQESDADRFFGRTEDTLSVVSRVREQPLVAVIGPSGAGKSSLVRAGVIPTLKRSGEGWQSLVARPGRAPLLALAELLGRLGQTSTRRTADGPRPAVSAASASEQPTGRDATVERLRAEPGYLGAALRAYAQRKLRQVLLFIDQFEEVYTLCADEDERAAFLACLAGVADDAGSPLRVVLSMRADFLERLAENRAFMALATRGLMLLPPMGSAGLRAALEKPLAAAGYGFESEGTVRDMLDGLEGTRGALPLLQFAATMLWQERDRERRLLTEDSYRAMGGIAGALAKHADSVVAAMTADRRKLARAVFERLVTPERTRAVVSVGELREIGGVDGAAVEEVLDELARARLLVVDAGSVEIVHESLIERWPTLRRWLDENQEDAAFLARLRTAAREWDGSGQVEGMLWRGQPAAEARVWRDGYAGELARLEGRFLDAVFAYSERRRRRRRQLIFAGVAALVLLVLAGGYAWIKGRNEAALSDSLANEREARSATAEARKEAEQRAKDARAAQVAEIAAREEAAERARAATAAEAEARKAEAEARAAAAEIEAANARIADLLAEARLQRERALAEADRARQAEKDALNAQKEADRLREEAERARDEVKRQKQKFQELIEQQGIKKLTLPGDAHSRPGAGRDKESKQ